MKVSLTAPEASKPSLVGHVLIIAFFCLGAYASVQTPWNPELRVNAMWLPSGIGLAMVVRYGFSVVPTLFIAYLITSQAFGTPMLGSLAGATGAVAEYSLGAYLVRRLSHTTPWRLSVRSVVWLVLAGAILAPMVGATSGAAALAVSGAILPSNLGHALAVWWTGNAIGVLVMFPAVYHLVFNRDKLLPNSIWQVPPLVLPVLVTTVIFVLVDANLLGAHAFEYIVFPLLAWGAIALSSSQVVLMTLGVVVAATLGTAFGRGPYAAGEPATNIWLLQAFVGITIATSLFLRAAIADRARSEEKRRALEQRFHAAADRNPSAVLVLRTVKAFAPVGKDFAVAYANERAMALLPQLRKTPSALFSEALAPDARDDCMPLYLNAAARQASIDSETEMTMPGIGRRWLRHQAVPLNDGLMLMLTDVTDHKAATDKARYLASHDSLTGLPNRTMLHEQLQHAIDDAKGTEVMIAVIFVDLDNFKAINDGHGHDIGNHALVAVADRLTRRVGVRGMVSRPGGDEFIVLANKLPDIAAAEALAQDMVAAIDHPIQIDTHTFDITCSVGVAIYPLHSTDRFTLMRFADTAMYHAKGSGKNRYQFFTDNMNATLQRRLSIEEALRGALQREELSLVYQPQVDIRSGELIGVEALIRWSNQALGAVAPAHFIGVAEDTGLISAIGQWVLQTACLQCRSLRDAGHHLPRMAVNLSVRQLDDSLPDIVRQALSAAKLDAKSLELEITESHLMRDVAKSTRILKVLAELGVTIAIDDFGTGYSSLSYLKVLPIHALKIDQSFVREAHATAHSTQILSAIVALAHNLNLRSVAEGVESKAELQLLRSLGCHEYQGFLHSEPMSAQALASRFLPRGEQAHHTKTMESRLEEI